MVYLITISGKVISYGLEYVKEKLFTKYQYKKSHSVLCNKSNTKIYSHVSQLLIAPLHYDLFWNPAMLPGSRPVVQYS